MSRSGHVLAYVQVRPDPGFVTDDGYLLALDHDIEHNVGLEQFASRAERKHGISEVTRETHTTASCHYVSNRSYRVKKYNSQLPPQSTNATCNEECVRDHWQGLHRPTEISTPRCHYLKALLIDLQSRLEHPSPRLRSTIKGRTCLLSMTSHIAEGLETDEHDFSETIESLEDSQHQSFPILQEKPTTTRYCLCHFNLRFLIGKDKTGTDHSPGYKASIRSASSMGPTQC
jgi:hypothetical protein